MGFIIKDSMGLYMVKQTSFYPQLYPLIWDCKLVGTSWMGAKTIWGLALQQANILAYIVFRLWDGKSPTKGERIFQILVKPKHG